MKQTSDQVVKSADVIGKKVISTNDEPLGKIEEIVLDKLNGDVRYAVLSFGGFMGLNTDYYAIPWESLSYCSEKEAFELGIDKDKLTSAKGFNKDNWPNFAEEYTRSIDDFYS